MSEKITKCLEKMFLFFLNYFNTIKINLVLINLNEYPPINK